MFGTSAFAEMPFSTLRGAGISYNAAVSETVFAENTQSAAFIFQSLVDERALFANEQTALANLFVTLLGAMSAADQQIGGLLKSVAVQEVVSVLTAQAASLNSNLFVNETAAASSFASSTANLLVSLSESARILTAVNAGLVISVSVSDLVSLAISQDVTASYDSQIFEVTSFVDNYGSVATFNTSINELVRLVGINSATAIFNVSLFDELLFSSGFVGRYSFELIDTTQYPQWDLIITDGVTPSFQVINNAQTPAWGVVESAGATLSVNPIDTAQGSDWVLVDMEKI